MEPNLDIIATETPTEPAPSKRQARPATSISLDSDDRAQVQVLRVPSLWDRVRGATADVVKPATQLRHLHTVSETRIAQRSRHWAERVTGEVAGALSGTARALGGAVVGITSGIVSGLRGISPAALKRFRLADAEQIVQIGRWTHTEIRTDPETGEPATTMVMDLATNPKALEGPARPGTYSISLANAVETTLAIGAVERPVILVPLKNQKTLLGLLVLSAETDKNVWLWLDA